MKIRTFEEFAKSIIIDPEFKALIPPLAPEEKALLEASIIEEGCRDNLIVWEPEMEVRILIDGHNRYDICMRNQIIFDVVEKCFDSRDEVLDWMIQNQLGRRNLTPDQSSYLRGLQYNREKQKQGTNNQHVKAKSEKAQIDTFHSEKSTAEKLAAQNGVSRETIKRDARYADAVDAVVNVAGADAKGVIGVLPRLDQVRLGEAAKIAPDVAKVALEMLADSATKNEAKTIVNQAVKEAQAIEAEIKQAERPLLELSSPQDRDEKIETEHGNIYILHRPNTKATLNRTNELVDWAFWTWNPVTGCHHGCVYCFARAIANNAEMAKAYPYQFEPVYHPYRLKAPFRQPPKDDDPRAKRIFTCSMADLFGKWVPQEWILSVFDVVRQCPQWDFLFLTKFPQRLKEINDVLGGFPDNAWIGTTVDTRARVKLAEKSFQGIDAKVKWLSCEPLLEDLQFESLEMFDLVVIGGQTASSFNNCPAFQPEWEWVENIWNVARQSGCKIYWKENLTIRPKELPTCL